MHNSSKILRLIFPQWQGGTFTPYYLGAYFLNWLAPQAKGPVEEIPVPTPTQQKLPLENGIHARQALLKQQRSARELIDKHSPGKIVTLGGDCLVDLVPFAYLNEQYDGDLAILWVDAHPDIMTPKDFQNAHAMVLGNLLGHGDKDFSALVEKPIKSQNVMYAGVHDMLEVETNLIKKYDLKNTSPESVAETSKPVIDWIQSIKVKHLAIHFDLDVLDPKELHSLLFNNPHVEPNTFDGIAKGKMTIQQVIRLLTDVAAEVDVVGIGITECFPWDAITLKAMLARLPLLGNS